MFLKISEAAIFR